MGSPTSIPQAPGVEAAYDAQANAGWLDCRPHGCPCGYLTDPRKECHCTPRQIQQYMSRITGPLLDRIDIQLEVPAVNYRVPHIRTRVSSSARTAKRSRPSAASGHPALTCNWWR
jgi:hypothetical protein